jgi:hypothetical protein
MPEESTTSDLVEFASRQLEAVNRRDLDALMAPVSLDGLMFEAADHLLYDRPRFGGHLVASVRLT